MLPNMSFAQEAYAARPDEDVDQVNLVVWQYVNIYEEIAAKFEADWGNPVEKVIEPNIEPQIAKLTTMFAAGEDIDVFVSILSTMASYIDQGIAAPLDGLPGVEDYITDMTPLARSTATVDGKLWGLPYLSIARAFAYNEELLGKAGFAGKPFRTWDELTEQCLKAKADGVSNYPLPWVGGPALESLPGTWFSQVCNRGGRIFDEDMNPEMGPGSIARETLQYFQDTFIKHEIADPDSLNLKFLPAVKVFNTGKRLYLGTFHNYFMNQMNDPAQSPIAGKGKTHGLPGDGATLVATWYYMMSDATRDREWAWKTLQYLGGRTKDGSYTQALSLAKSSMLYPGFTSVAQSDEVREAWSDLATCEAAAQRFAELGAEVVPADPDLSGAMEIAKRNWQAIMSAIVFHRLGDHLDALDPALVACARGALTQTSGEFLFDKVNAFPIYQRLVAWFGRHDLLLTPAVSCLPVTNGRLLPEDYPEHDRDWMDWAPFSSPFNLFHNPAASVPAGLSKDGLPIGLQIVGPRHADTLVLQASRAYERAAPWAYQRPPE